MTLTYLINYPPYLLITLFTLFSVMVLLFYGSYQKLKKKESQKINAIYTELKLERSISKNLQKVPHEIEKIELETHKKFMRVRVDIMTIDFTISEILK